MEYVYLKLVNDSHCRFPLDVGGVVFGRSGSWHIVEEDRAKLLRKYNPNILIYCDQEGNALEEAPEVLAPSKVPKQQFPQTEEAVERVPEQLVQPGVEAEVLDIAVPKKGKKR